MFCAAGPSVNRPLDHRAQFVRKYIYFLNFKLISSDEKLLKIQLSPKHIWDENVVGALLGASWGTQWWERWKLGELDGNTFRRKNKKRSPPIPHQTQ
jgi:hypothetical protein